MVAIACELAKAAHLVVKIELYQFELLNNLKALSMKIRQLASCRIMRTDSYELY